MHDAPHLSPTQSHGRTIVGGIFAALIQAFADPGRQIETSDTRRETIDGAFELTQQVRFELESEREVFPILGKMSPPSKHRTRSTGKAPDIPLPPNGKIPQAPKPGRKTWQRQPEDADKDIELDPPAPTPAPPCPAPRKKSGAVSRVAPGAGAEDE
ncbi:hypothetical protein DXG01_012853, partial [Tephrocybe rancida]